MDQGGGNGAQAWLYHSERHQRIKFRARSVRGPLSPKQDTLGDWDGVLLRINLTPAEFKPLAASIMPAAVQRSAKLCQSRRPGYRRCRSHRKRCPVPFATPTSHSFLGSVRLRQQLGQLAMSPQSAAPRRGKLGQDLACPIGRAPRQIPFDSREEHRKHRPPAGRSIHDRCGSRRTSRSIRARASGTPP
jgi:hypothetical protein